MDTNKRKTGLARLIEIAGTKRRLLIGAMLLAVITAIVQFVPIIAVYNILIELAEHALDPVYAGNLGVDIDSLLVSQPDYGEQALEITEQLVRSGAVDIIVVDSVAALVPRTEIDGEMGDSHVGLHARLMSQAMRKLTGAINKSNCLIIFINQLREKVGVVYGNPEVTTGGRALKFYSSMRIDVRKAEAIKAAGSEAVSYTHLTLPTKA